MIRDFTRRLSTIENVLSRRAAPDRRTKVERDAAVAAALPMSASASLAAESDPARRAAILAALRADA